MTTTAPEALDLQRAARDHLWLHFTRMGGRDAADHRPRRRLLPRGLERQALPRRARRAVRGAGRLLVRRGDGPGRARADARAAVLHQLVVRASARDRARAEVASLAPGDLNRVFFVSGGSEAVESAWKLARQYYTARGERRWKAIAGHRLPRHDDGRALDQRHPGAARAVRAARAGRAARAQHEPLPPAARGDRGSSSPRSCSTTSSRRSCRPGRRRSRW